MQVLKSATPAGFTSQWARNWDQSNAPSGPPAIIRNINPSTLGVYDWTSFDLFFSNNAGKKLVFTLGQPADWMITRAAIGGANFGGKANMCPTGATELTTNYLPAITAIVDRAKNTHGATGVHWELWNEIEGPGFYADAHSALGPYAKAVSQAIKAVDATAVVLTPSARDADTAYFVGNFLAVSDGAAGKGGDWVDGMATHVYMAQDPYSGNGAWSFKIIVDTYRQQAINAGYPSLPLYITESGSLIPLNQLGPFIQRRMLVFAGLGVKAFVAYAADFTGAPLAQYVGRWNETLTAIAGKTITSLVKNEDTSVTAIVNGVPYTV